MAPPNCLLVLVALSVTALASPTLVPKHDSPYPTVIDLTDAPLVTEVVPCFTESLTTINKGGKYTLGLGCHGLFGLGCLVTTTSVPGSTVCTITSVTTKTTTYPCSTSTTYTECGWDPRCGCSTTKTYRWTPTSCPAGVTVTATATATATVTETSTDTTTVTGITTATATATVTKTSTDTVTGITTSSASCSSAPALTCDKYGYLVQHATFIRVDLATGTYETVAEGLGDGSNLNALGYNVFDNYLYARQDDNKLLRIASDGTTTNVLTFPSNLTPNMGDIDTDGFYWYTATKANYWVQMDLRPGSPTYGAIVGNGTITTPEPNVFDWVYIPVGGSYLWSISSTSGSGSAALVRFSMVTKEWETVQSYTTVSGSFGALYGMNNGTIFASDNISGYIYGFPIDGSTPWKSANGPTSNDNDGARCVLNLSV